MSKMKSWEEMQINDMLVIETIRKSSSDTIYFKDKDSRFIWNNYEHARQLGANSPDEVTGRASRPSPKPPKLPPRKLPRNNHRLFPSGFCPEGKRY